MLKKTGDVKQTLPMGATVPAGILRTISREGTAAFPCFTIYISKCRNTGAKHIGGERGIKGE
jgi:hypothetical protein